MRKLLLIAALMTGSAAIAQNKPAEETMPQQTTTTTSTTTHSGMDHSGMGHSGTQAANNSAPEHDARGIAVISDAAEVPAGYNGTAGMAQPMAAPQEYPACSRTVTDNCVQTYERGSRRPRKA